MALLYTLLRVSKSDRESTEILCVEAPLGRVLAELGKEADKIEASARSESLAAARFRYEIRLTKALDAGG